MRDQVLLQGYTFERDTTALTTLKLGVSMYDMLLPLMLLFGPDLKRLRLN